MTFDNFKKKAKEYIEEHTNPPVFFISASIIIFVAIFGMLYSAQFEKLVIEMNKYLITQFRYLIILSTFIFLILSVYLFFSKYRNIKLGDQDSVPEYSYFAWIAMLFSAGMGIGMLFYGVAEPVTHFANTPDPGDPASDEITAMKYTFLNWGLHAWATYVIVGLSLAYIGFRKKLPLSIKYTFYPILKEKVYGKTGNIIDIFAVVSTLFGVATSLGLGVMQINSGLSYLFGVENNSLMIQIMLIAFITMLATISVVSGVKRGIKWFSITNVVLASLLLLFVFVFGPTAYIFKSMFINTGYYAKDFIEMSLFKTFSLDSSWLSSWTLFYWAWWISWSPYVGMFIARISKGRTIKEFIFGVLLVPTVISFFWLTAFGNTSIDYMNNGNQQIEEQVSQNVSTSLFVLFENMPFDFIVSLFGVILIITFFVTSSDSGSFVIDIITSGGQKNPKKIQRVFWSLLEGTTAAVLLIGGGLVTLQTSVITMAVPFSIILLFMGWSIIKGLSTECPIYITRNKNLKKLKDK